MENIIENNRSFIPTGSGETTYYFDREYKENVADIASSAALAMHKAIIGICELASLEKAENDTEINFRASKAVHCYYVIYHLFTCCMLLDSDYEIKFKANKDGKIVYGTRLEDLRKQPTRPGHWNSRKNKESDLAVRIRHGDIKTYCDGQRQYANRKWETIQKGLRDRIKESKELLPRFLVMLYDYFVDENCQIILFEKADYIRDRTIYRPSHVASMTDTPIQTSKNVRSQIDSMPNSEVLLKAVYEIHKAICMNTGELFYAYGFNFLLSAIDCPSEYAKSLGYSWDDLNRLGGDEAKESVPSFICQLMELYDSDQVVQFYDQYWVRILEETKEIIFSDLHYSDGQK